MYQHSSTTQAAYAYGAERSSPGTGSHVRNDQAHGPGMATIGAPIHVSYGQFAGQCIRAELHEIQKADLGRKYARVDRRPLDPPPVVWLRIFIVHNEGSAEEYEKEIENYNDVETVGFVCTLDLFPVHHRGARLVEVPVSTSRDPSLHYSELQGPYTTSMASHPAARAIDYGYESSPYAQSASTQNLSFSGSVYSTTTDGPSRFPSPPEEEAMYIYDGYPIREQSKLTDSLVGQKHVQPACVDYQGRKALMFVFADIAVKIEGSFILRYRVFDIFSGTQGSRDYPAQAECYGNSFRVYSTKEFPGLQGSTELTKQLARWGVRLNIRETPRKRRKKSESDINSGQAGGSTTRKRRTRDAKPDSGDDE